MKKHLPTIILIFVFLVGLSLLLYPTVSDLYNSFHQTRAIAEYSDKVYKMDNSSYKKLLSRARAYNKEIAKTGGGGFLLSQEELERYDSVLNVSNGMIGYVEIPAIRSKLPIFHGTSEKVLSAGVGHIQGSSFPVGGKSTHTVLSGHRGLPSAKLFTDLDKLVEGDVFYLYVLDEVLTYQVDQIRIVEPEDTSNLLIEKGKDYCTLVTCTPYGINSHRLLVRGHRVASDSSDLRVTSDAMQVDRLLVSTFVAVPLIVILLIALLIRTRKTRRRKRKK